MAIRFSCDRCGKQRRVKDSYAGKKVTCPACGTAQRIPASQSTENEAARDEERENAENPSAAQLESTETVERRKLGKRDILAYAMLGVCLLVILYAILQIGPDTATSVEDPKLHSIRASLVRFLLSSETRFTKFGDFELTKTDSSTSPYKATVMTEIWQQGQKREALKTYAYTDGAWVLERSEFLDEEMGKRPNKQQQ